MKAHELDLDSIVFAEMRCDLNRAIQESIREMKEKGLSEGSVSAKIKIGLMRTVDENGEIHATAIFEPKVTAKIGKSSEDKCGATGGRITVGDDGTLLIGSDQVTMDELMDSQKGA